LLQPGLALQETNRQRFGLIDSLLIPQNADRVELRSLIVGDKMDGQSANTPQGRRILDDNRPTNVGRMTVPD
jgi:hypothetical protein